MFFTIGEQAFVNPIYYISTLGLSVPVGFITYGLDFTTVWRPWKWYWLIIGVLSGLGAIAAFFVFPDNPTTVKGFTLEEKVYIIQKVKNASKYAIEQKTFKKHHFMEALKDPISWAFFLFSLLNMLGNSAQSQVLIIYQELGISRVMTILLIVINTGYFVFVAISTSIFLHFRR